MGVGWVYDGCTMGVRWMEETKIEIEMWSAGEKGYTKWAQESYKKVVEKSYTGNTGVRNSAVTPPNGHPTARPTDTYQANLQSASALAPLQSPSRPGRRAVGGCV
jgi:hypothetical protein